MKRGYVFKRGKNWYVAIPDTSRKNGYKRMGGFGRKSLAKQFLDDRKYQIEDVQVRGKGKGNILYKEAFKEVLRHAESSLSKETYKSYRGIVKDFVIFTAQKYPNLQRLYELKHKIFDDYKLWLKDTGYSDQHVRQYHKSSTINNHLKVFKAIFNKLIDWEYLDRSPIKRIELVAVNDKKKIIAIDTPERFKLFFERCKSLKPEYYNHYYCSVKLGLRFGEMVSLKWENVDFERAIVKIVADGEFTPKGRCRKDKEPKRRIIPISEDVVRILKSLPKERNYVFLKKGKPIDRRDKSFRRWIISIVRGTMLEGMTRFHELRHSAGRILGQKYQAHEIKEFLGHSDIRTTLRYVNTADKSKKLMAETLGGFDDTTQFTTQERQ